ncbi:MAG: hypothetical protein ACPG4V_07995, partial [Limisphaerales bacterium]
MIIGSASSAALTTKEFVLSSATATTREVGFGAEEEDLLLLELLRLSLLLRPLSRCSLQARILSKNEEELELELP